MAENIPASLNDTKSPDSPSTAHTGTRRLRLTFKAEQCTQAMAQANQALVVPFGREALRRYTDILRDNTGHIGALLNRSMCYLILDYPHLAVADAHRALLATQHCLKTSADTINGRANLYNLHLYTLSADPEVDQWIAKPACYVGKSGYRFLDVKLASISIKARRRESHNLPFGTSEEQYTQRGLLDDALLKAYYRLALALWKCGGGAWQSALDQIYVATDLKFLKKSDKNQFQALQNQILFEIEKVLNEESEINKMKARKGLAPDAIGIRELLKSRFTKTKRELYPWDPHGVAMLNDPLALVEELNDQKMVANNVFRYDVKMYNQLDRPPVLVLRANETVRPDQLIFKERTTMRAVMPPPPLARWCGTCGASIDIAKDAVKEARQHAKIYDRFLHEETWSASLRTKNESCSDEKKGDVDGSNDENDKQLKSDPAHVPRSGYQVCSFCGSMAFCSIECRELGIEGFHQTLCRVRTSAYQYDLFVPDPWSIPNPRYIRLSQTLLERVIALAGTSGLNRLWMRVMDGQLLNPPYSHKEWLDCETPSLDGPSQASDDTGITITNWHDDRSIAINVLYPNRTTIRTLVRELENGNRRDSTTDVETNMTTPYTMDWSYDTAVRQPIRVLYDAFCKTSLADGMKAMLDIEYDGWVLDTIRMKVDAHMRIQKYPLSRKIFDPDGNLVERHDTQREDVKDPYGGPLMDSHGWVRWMASLHALTTSVRPADPNQGECPNVKIEDKDGRTLVTSIREIKKGEILCT